MSKNDVPRGQLPGRDASFRIAGAVGKRPPLYKVASLFAAGNETQIEAKQEHGGPVPIRTALIGSFPACGSFRWTRDNGGPQAGPASDFRVCLDVFLAFCRLVIEASACFEVGYRAASPHRGSSCRCGCQCNGAARYGKSAGDRIDQGNGQALVGERVFLYKPAVGRIRSWPADSAAERGGDSVQQLLGAGDERGVSKLQARVHL